jgi:hypothetical protein
MPALLGSDCCHVLLHALAVAADANPAAAAVTVTGVLSGSSGLPAVLGGSSAGVDAGDAAGSCHVVVAAPQQASLAWQLLRMICAQCTQASRNAVTRNKLRSQQSSGSDSDGGSEQPVPSAAAAGAAEKRHKASSLVQPQQVLRVVQAYAEHIPSVAPLVPRLLGSLHVLLCQAALVTQQQQQQQQQVHVQSAAMAAEAAAAGSSSSSSYSMVVQLLHRAPSIPSLRGLAQKLSPHWESMRSQLAIGPPPQQPPQQQFSATHRASSSSSNGSSSGNSGGRCQGLAWQLPTCAYVVLSVALAVQNSGLGPGGIELSSSLDQLHDEFSEAEGYHGELSIVLAAARMAAAVLHVLLPALLGSSSSSSVRTPEQQQQQGEAAAAVPPHCSSSSSSCIKEAPIALQGVVECSLATLQALMLLTRHLQAGLGAGINSGRSLLSCGVADCKTAEEAAAVKAAQAAAAGLAAALDSRLCGLLEHVVSAWSAAESAGSEEASCKVDSSSATSHPCNNSSGSSSSSGSSATSVQAALQHQLQQEIRCWAAAALAACYGQLGANSSQGQLLAAAQQPGAIRANTELQLADGGAAIAVHAAVLAAGCPVLGQQLQQQQQGRVAGAQLHSELHASSPLPGGKLRVKLSAAVDRAALQAALNYVYTGAAAIPEASLTAQLIAAGASKPKQQQQQQGCTVQQLQEDGQQQLAGLARLAKKLQLQLLAALCRQVTPSPGVQLQLLHPQLRSLLPQQLLLLEMPQWGVVTQQQQQQCCEEQDRACHCRSVVGVREDGDSRERAAALEAGTASDVVHQGSAELELKAAAAAPAGEMRDSSSSTCCSSSSIGRQNCGHHLLCTEAPYNQAEGCGMNVKDTSDASSTGIVGNVGSMPSTHSSSSAYLGTLARCMESDSTPAAVYVTSKQQQQQLADTEGSSQGAAAAVPVVQAAADLGYADVVLAAPVVLQVVPSTQQQQQQQQQHCEAVLALLPAHQVLLSGCGYFEALFSQRWHRSQGWQGGFQDSCSSSSAGNGIVHDAAADGGNSADGSHGSSSSSDCSCKATVGIAAAHDSSSSSSEVQAMRRLQLVLVPEADIHVAAALQHWLYTGELQIALPPHTAASCHRPQEQQLQGGSVTKQLQQQQQRGLVQLNGCSPACHACRTLLRLWRCADLLLLTALQEQSLAALEAAVAQLLPCECCVVLLQDCCLLGVPPAADCVIAGLLSRFGEWYNWQQRNS